RAVRQFVIERASKDAGGRRFSDAAHAGEDPGLRDAAALEGVRKRSHHGVLTDEIIEACPPVFACEPAITVSRHIGLSGTGSSRFFSLAHCAIRFASRAEHGLIANESRNWWEADERPEPRSLGLLPSGPDPVGEWLVHRQPPVSISGQ